jgi:hypothetical protein
MIDIKQPLVWTVKGNLPTAECPFRPEWDETDDAITLNIIYTHNGEEVRRDVYVRGKKGLMTTVEQPQL